MNRKKVLFIVSVIFYMIFTFNCTSTVLVSKTDYDETTFEKKDFSDAEVLGEVKVSYLLSSWKQFSVVNDKKTLKVLASLENKAIKKYGKNINLIDMEISNYDKSKSTGLYIGLPITGLATMITGAVMSENNILSDNIAYPIAFMGSAIPLATPFLKIGTAKATVIKSSTPYQSVANKLTTKDVISYNVQVAKDRKERELLQAQKKQELAKKEHDKATRVAELNTRLSELEKQIKPLNESLEKSKKKAFDNAIKEFSDKSPIIFTPPKNFSSYSSLLVGGKLYGNTIVDSRSGRVDLAIDFINIYPKLIKYVYFDVVPYNRVGDAILNKAKTLEVVDFILPYQKYCSICDSVWYDKTIQFFKITKIQVVYNDNSVTEVTDENIISKAIYFESNTEISELTEKISALEKEKSSILKELDDLSR